MRPLALALVAIVVLWAAGTRAADPARRAPAGALHQPAVDEDADVGEGADDAEPGDESLDDGRMPPSEPPLRAPLRPVPRGEEEEAPAPGEHPPTNYGPAEPASAARPLSPS